MSSIALDRVLWTPTICQSTMWHCRRVHCLHCTVADHGWPIYVWSWATLCSFGRSDIRSFAALNYDQIEVLWCTSAIDDNIDHRPKQSLVEPVKSARDQGIYIDCDLRCSPMFIVQCTCSRCFAMRCQLRQIPGSVLTDTFLTLVVSLVLNGCISWPVFWCTWPAESSRC